MRNQAPDVGNFTFLEPGLFHDDLAFGSGRYALDHIKTRSAVPEASHAYQDGIVQVRQLRTEADES